MKRGFTLVENLVAVAIFALLAGAIYQTSALLIRSVGAYRENTTISSLANQYMEIVHNLPYSNVGVVQGNPGGSLPSVVSATSTLVNGTPYKIYYAVSYFDDPADGTIGAGDSSSADYKQIKLYIKNITTEKSYSFLTNITPKGLEGLNGTGALVISVFDANGQPIPNATINISNTTIFPNISILRTTDALGKWTEVGLATSSNSYNVTATKSGYSTDQTYPITVTNPNPVKPDSTILSGQVTQVSLEIDKLSDLSFETLDQSCNVLSNISLNVKGAKRTGLPSLLKFDNDYTSNYSGKIALNNIEWDSYTPTLTGNTYMVYGSSPIQQVNVLPDTTQNYTLLLGPKTDHSLLVIVKDSATGNPVEDATVQLKNTSPSFDQTKITGGSVWSSTSWEPTAGQEINNLNTDILPYALRLLSYNVGTTYETTGNLTSTVFDTGTSSTTYSTINWQPESQDPATEIKFQIATNNENTSTTTWDFIGPDGTDTTYYNNSGTTINSSSARYVRYKTFLSTSDQIKTPVLTNLNINYVSGCFTPGQVFFSNLTSDDSYNLNITADGYTDQLINNLNIVGYNTITVSL